jgi:2'-5' RNA ligase
MNNKRIQLTLFIPEQDAIAFEKVRKAHNPEQYKLIHAHITLCREDELDLIDHVILNLEKLQFECFPIDFGKVERFSQGKGVLLPAIGDNEVFQKLRSTVLKGIIDQPRKHEPHITLMHPRNATCTDKLFESIQKNSFPQQIIFDEICLIEQEIGKKWEILKTYKLNKQHKNT